MGVFHGDEMAVQISAEPAAADPGGPGPGATTRKRARLIVLAVLGAVVLAGVIAVGPTAWRIAEQRNTGVVLPEAIGNLVRDDSAQASETSEYLISALQATVDLDTGAGAVYADPDEGPASSVILAVGAATLLFPERELDAVLQVLGDGTAEPVVWQAMTAGTRGGTLKCGGEAAQVDEMTICGWADHGSIALALFPERNVDESAALLLQVRAAVLS